MSATQGKPVGFQQATPNAVFFRLSDGFYLKSTLVIAKILKTAESSPAGTPEYSVLSQTVNVVLTKSEFEAEMEMLNHGR